MTTMSEPLADARDMFAVHTMFRREFGLMPGLVRAVTSGDTQRATLVADHVALVSEVLNLHHSGEDKQIWPLLRARCPQQSASLVDVMEDQHHVIHVCFQQVRKAEKAWRASASADTRDELADAIDWLIPASAGHLAVEEEHAVPLIEKHLTQAEYALLAQRGNAGIPPDKLPTIFGMIMYEADPSVIGMAVAQMPAKVQPVIKDLAASAYAAYARELYGSATPARVTG
jgi:hemerythrin-like domain-containing protein